MSLQRVDLDSTPGEIVSLLAAEAAVRAAVGLETPAPAGGTLHWEGPDGMWAALVRPGEGRALLTGGHPGFDPTEGIGRAGEPGTDLVTDAPGWWRRGMDHARAKGLHPGFLFGWDGSGWWRAGHPTGDGFDPGLFPVTRRALRGIIDELADSTLLDPPGDEAVEALLDAGPDLSAAHLSAVLHSPDGWPEVDPSAGVRAARAYLSRSPA